MKDNAIPFICCCCHDVVSLILVFGQKGERLAAVVASRSLVLCGGGSGYATVIGCGKGWLKRYPSALKGT
jgi:hypothetical protein